jgi:osmoprotectant transport system ATP-binding protein
LGGDAGSPPGLVGRVVIELRGVSKIFRGPRGEEVVAVDAVDLVVERGETLCLIGTSGCGKTTTMKLINRLLEPTSGSVRLDGADVRDSDIIRLRRRIGYVLQKGGLFPHMTVAENVGLLCRLEGWVRGDIDRRVSALLALVNLPAEQFGERYPKELSGGQRQRVGVARALALDPDCILMDEPFGALDPITRAQIHDEFASLKQAMDKTVVLVTHDMAEAFKLGDRVALMDGGRLVQIGTEVDFRERPANAFVSEFLKSQIAGMQDG